jgi:hypothetical protein
MAIKFKDIEDGFDFLNFGMQGEHQAFLNIHTGKIYWYSEFGDNEEELPEDIDNEEIYIELPHKNELDLGKKLVINFSNDYLPEEIEKIESIFSKKGAYSKYKILLEQKDMLDKWYEYESKAQEEALREWCKLSEIEITD